jgi:hypothetical protein
MLKLAVPAFMLGLSACGAHLLGDPIKGKDGCYYNAEADRTYCRPGSTGQARYAAEERQRKWVGRKQIDVEMDPWFSVRKPDIRTLSDGAVIWTYSEAAPGRCDSSPPKRSSTCTTSVDPLTNLARTNCVESAEDSGKGRCEARDMNHLQFVIRNGVIADARFIPVQ